MSGFEVHKAKVRRRWYVVLRAGNGEVLSTSELLNSERAAYENIDAQLRAASIEAALRATDDA